MNLIDKIKAVIYSRQLADLEMKLLEMQAAYIKLEIENNKLSYQLTLADRKYRDLEKSNTTLQNNFTNQEYFISKLKGCSDKLNNLFFEDGERRY